MILKMKYNKTKIIKKKNKLKICNIFRNKKIHQKLKKSEIFINFPLLKKNQNISISLKFLFNNYKKIIFHKIKVADFRVYVTLKFLMTPLILTNHHNLCQQWKIHQKNKKIKINYSNFEMMLINSLIKVI